MFNRIFLDHPQSVDETFFQHMRFALRFSGALFAAAGAALVHALYPWLVTTISSPGWKLCRQRDT
mgnify:CR=1 FL=1